MIKWNNMLLVSGTSRNVGKTTFACKMIKHIAKKSIVVAIKITPHFHELCSSCNILYQSDELIISQEMNGRLSKDSSMMLAAGAQKVYYVQGNDLQLNKIIEFLRPLIPDSSAIVCESAALRSLIIPGLFVLMSIDKSMSIKKNMDKISLADFHFWDYKYSIDCVGFEDGIWKKNPTLLHNNNKQSRI